MSNEWFVMEEIDNSHPLLAIDAKTCCVDAYKYGIPKGTVTQTVIKSEKDFDLLCFRRGEFNATARAFYEKILSNIEWAMGISDKIIETSTNLMQLSNKIHATDISEFSNEDLAELLENWANTRREAHGYGMPWNYVEYENGHFSTYVTKYIEKKIQEKKLDLDAGKIFSVLSMPLKKTFAQTEQEEILRLALDAKRNENLRKLFEQNSVQEILQKLEQAPEFERGFNMHFENYCWLPYMYLGPAWDKNYFIAELRNLLGKTEADLDSALKEKQNYLQKVEKEQEQIMSQLEFDEFHRKCVKLAQSFLYTKAFRKDAIYHGFYSLEPTFRECAKRLGVSLKQFRMIMSWELKAAVTSGKVDATKLDERYAFRLFHYDGKTKTILSGDAAKKFWADLDFEKIEITSVSELKGNCACPGNAKGVVKIINLPEEMEKMNSGDILVSKATTPDIVPAMKKASAIITDMGGITCHAAIVSRELKIPCVIGAKVATRILKDGDLIEVDATKGIVKILKK